MPFTRTEPTAKALDAPVGECRQCWFHAHAPREAHKHLTPGKTCKDCLSHVKGCPPHMIVKAEDKPGRKRGWW